MVKVGGSNPSPRTKEKLYNFSFVLGEGFELSVNIPIITNQKTIDFLEKNAWHDWVSKNKEKSDIIETVLLLSKLYPNHKKSYFHELESIISSYASGVFISYDDNGNVEIPSDEDIKGRKYYTSKYRKFNFDNIDIKNAYDAYIAEKDEKIKDKKFDIYQTLSEEYSYKNHCLDEVFINIGENVISCSTAFSKNTAQWSLEKNGKLIGYAHAGEIYFVVTDDTIYFEIKRHF